jgi:hypothetical protein
VPDLVRLARRWDATDQPMKHNVSTTLWTQFLNLKYACAHGYSLIFYQLVGHGCRHPLWGQRHPSYCKLAAVAETLAAGYGWVVCVDSDAFFQSTGSKAFLELRALLRAYGATAEDAAGNGARALFGWDAPYTLGPNAGFMVLRNSPETRELLSVWWNLRSGARGLEHPYEQHALQWRLVHLQRYRSRVATLSLRTMDPSYPDAVVHLDHNAGTKTRTWVMARAAAELLAPRYGARLKPWLPQLRQSRAKMSYAKREKAVAAVVRAAADDLENGTRPNGGGACAAELRRFNATASALRHMATLPARGASLLLGLPLEIRNCSEHATDAPWQSWVLTEGPRRPHRRGGTSRTTDVLMVDDHPPTNSSAEEPHRFSLRAHPHVCLHVGATRALKPPYESLAVLGPCDGNGRGAAAAERGAVRLAAGGMITSVRRLHALRRLLPDFRSDCGFWPNCTRTRFVLPKVCWAALESDTAACGDSEPQLATHLARYAKRGPAWRRVAVGPNGPLPAPMLAANDGERLCLGAWRGRFEDGSAATWAACPKAGRTGHEQSKWKGPEQLEWAVEPDPVRPGEGGVRLVPAAAPHLCLSAPAILAGGRAPGEA